MRYGELDTRELREVAYADAATFTVDPAKLEDRKTIEAYTIEKEDTAERGLAISVAEEDNQQIFRVSVAETGSFIERESALGAYAMRILWTIEGRGGPRTPMLPPEISEDKLSFVEGQPRPAFTLNIPVDPEGRAGTPTITQDLLVATNLPPRQFEDAVFDDPDGIGRIDEASKWLLGIRKDNMDAPLLLQNDTGAEYNVDGVGGIGLFVRQEAVFALNAMGAALARNADIPFIFRNQGNVFPDDWQNPLDAPATYSAVAQGHLGLGLLETGLLHLPLSNLASLASQANLIALLQGHKLPYNRKTIERHLISRLDIAQIKERSRAARQDSPRPRARRNTNTQHALALSRHFENGVANEADAALVLHGSAIGSAEDIEKARQGALKFLSENITLGRGVLEISLAKGWLRRRAACDLSFVVADQKGNEFTYAITDDMGQNALTLTKLVAKIAGYDIDPPLPENLTHEGAILRDPISYLSELNSLRSIRFVGKVMAAPPGKATIRARITFDGEPHIREVTADSKKAALRTVGRNIIKEFDLINNPPAPNSAPPWAKTQPKKKKQASPKQPEKKTELSPNDIPFQVLARHAGRSLVDAPIHQAVSSEAGAIHCNLTFINADGEPQTITASGASYSEARDAAAAEALTLLPPMPVKARKRKKLWKQQQANAPSES